MKPIFLSTIISLFLTFSLTAQTNLQGIYLLESDFVNHKISYSPVEGKKYKFHLNEFANSLFINIVICDSTFKFYKDSVFGYRNKEGICFRFYQKNSYEIISLTQEIVLYKQVIKSGLKNSEYYTNYYFSVNTNSPLQPLSKWNLKNAFFTNNEFHELLDMYFNNDSDLCKYDNFYQTYKLNTVLKKSIK